MRLIELLKSLEAEIADQFQTLESFHGAGEIEIKYGFRTILYFDFSSTKYQIDNLFMQSNDDG